MNIYEKAPKRQEDVAPSDSAPSRKQLSAIADFVYAHRQFLSPQERAALRRIRRSIYMAVVPPDPALAQRWAAQLKALIPVFVSNWLRWSASGARGNGGGQ